MFVLCSVFILSVCAQCTITRFLQYCGKRPTTCDLNRDLVFTLWAMTTARSVSSTILRILCVVFFFVIVVLVVRFLFILRLSMLIVCVCVCVCVCMCVCRERQSVSIANCGHQMCQTCFDTASRLDRDASAYGYKTDDGRPIRFDLCPFCFDRTQAAPLLAGSHS